MQGIYSWTNKIDNKVYVGQDTNMPHRYSEHMYEIKKGNHFNKHFQSAVNKYGIENFTYEEMVCGPFDLEDLTEIEQFYIDKYKVENRCYNILPANKSRLGTKHTQETKNKISKVHKGKVVSEESRNKMSVSRIGNKYCLGHVETEEHKNNISKSMKGKQNSLGCIRSDSFKQNLLGNKHASGVRSEEFRKQRSDIMKRIWATRKAATKPL